MSREANFLVKILLVVGALAIAVSMVWPHQHNNRHYARRRHCQTNLKQIGLAFAQYVSDADEKMPVLSTNLGWKGLISPYVKSEAIFQCPSLEVDENPTDYWFNRRLSGRSVNEVTEVSQTILAGEGNEGTDAVSPDYNYGDLPLHWRTDPKSPANRHLKWANYLFVDGHVKAYRPAKIKTRSSPTEPAAQFAWN